MLKVSEQWQSGGGTVGKNAQSSYSAWVWGNPLPVSQGGDNANDAMTIVQFALSEFSLVDPFGNVFSDFDREKKAEGRWLVTAKYKSVESNRQTNDAAFSFNTGGGRVHIQAGIKVMGSYSAYNLQDLPTPDFGTLINVSKSGGHISVAGVEIQVSQFKFKTTHYIDPADMTTGFVNELYTLTACANSDVVTFNIDGINLTCQPGELLFEGANGQKRSGIGDWELNLEWDCAPNTASLYIGDPDAPAPPGFGAIGPITKRGQDYLWVYSKENSDDAASEQVTSPMAAYVIQVYQYQALSGLIPVSSFGNSNIQPWQNLGTISGGSNIG